MLYPDLLVIRRSPAKVCWHILYGAELITTADTKAEAEIERTRLLESMNH